MNIRARAVYMRSDPRQRGFSLIAAVFLIVVLAALGTFAVQVAMSQYQSGNVELLEAQAQAAANSGIGYAADLALSPAGTCRANSLLPTQRRGPLAGFVIKLTCIRTSHQISGTPYYAYALTSNASYGTYGQPNYVARSAARNVTKAPP